MRRDASQADPGVPERARRFAEAAVASVPLIILLLDPQGQIQFVNPHFTSVTGYSPEEVMGRDWFATLLPERYRTPTRERFQAALVGGPTRGHVDPILTRAGEEREIEWIDQLQRDALGNGTGLLCIGQDMTARRRAEAALRQREAMLQSVVDGAPLVIFALDRDGRFTLSEGKALSLVGLESGQAVGLSAFELFADVPGLSELLRRALAGERVHGRSRVGTVWFDVTYTPSFDVDGNAIGVLGVAFDVTEQVQAEEALKHTRDQLDATLSALPDLLFEVDEQGRLFGYYARSPAELPVPPERFLGKTFHEVLPQAAADACLEAIGEASAAGQALGPPYGLNMPDGERWYEASVARRASLPGEGRRFVLLARDVTARVVAKQALLQSERLFRTLAQVSPVGIYRITQGRCSYVNERLCEITGLTREKATTGGWWSCVHPHDLERARQEWARAAHEGKAFSSEYRCVRPDGSVGWVMSEARAELDSDGNVVGYVGTLTDVTQRKTAEEALRESEARYHSVVAALSEGVVLNARDGAITASNAAAERILGLSSAQLRGRTPLDSRWRAIHEDGTPFPGEEHPSSLALQSGSPQNNVIMGVHKPDDSTTWISINAVPIFTPPEPLPSAAVVSFADITSTKAAADALKQSLAEKSLLLQEVHHRVKNNLQLVSSLLDLQQSRTLNVDARTVLEESRSRVRAIAAVHELLSQAVDLSRVDFAEYLRRVTRALVVGHARTSPSVELTVDAPEKTLLEIGVAIPCGLIVNELLTNVFKYAYPDGRAGKAKVALQRTTDGQFGLSVADDGIGLPEEVDVQIARSLGLTLVRSLAAQIGAALRVERSSGTRFELTFRT